MATAAGLAYAGKTVFVSTYAIFATSRPWEQIRMIGHDNLNVKIVATHAGLTNGPDGASHQSLEDIALMRVIPNMKVFVPADAEETRQMILAAAHDDGPHYIRLSRAETPVVFDSSYQFKPGKGFVLREGNDVAIIAAGNMVSKAVEAHDVLRQNGIFARTVNLSTIKPLDIELIRRVAHETGAVVTAEEHSVLGGIRSAVAEVICENHPVPMESVGVRDRFGQSGKTEELYELYHLTKEDIVRSAMNVISRKRSTAGL